MNKILDYEQVIQRLSRISLVKKMKPIGYSTFGLPILYYKWGNGERNIVFSGAMHGAEIITTDMVLMLMENLPLCLDKANYTLHFIPLLNPEGYLICTSAVRKLISREMSNSEAQHIIKKYVKLYNDVSLDYQKMFENVDYTCIPDIYINLKNNIKMLYEKYSIPRGTLQVWSSNGNGVDLNQNCPFNTKLAYMGKNNGTQKKSFDMQDNGKMRINNAIHNNDTYEYEKFTKIDMNENDKREKINIYGKGAYKNIVVTQPGPIGCPSKTNNFEYEPETRCFRQFILNLEKNTKLSAYFNYHSAEDTIFYRPMVESITDDIKKNCRVLPYISNVSKYNARLAIMYASKTSHKLNGMSTPISCFNDMLRLEIMGDLLIELSPNEGNPLSAYEDSVYEKTVEENLSAVEYVLTFLDNF